MNSTSFRKTRGIIAALLAAVVLIEAAGYGARTYYRLPETIVTVPDPILHHVFTPMLDYIDTARAIPNHIFMNEQSWAEDYVISEKKAPGTYRIFYVGDSTTHGSVNKAYRVPEIVESELNKIYEPQGVRIETINTGTSSYSTMLYYLLVKTKLLSFDPDLVIIAVDMTDVPNDVTYRKTAVYNDSSSLTAVHAPDESARYAYQLTPHGEVRVPIWRQYVTRSHVFLARNSVIVQAVERVTFPVIKKMLGGSDGNRVATEAVRSDADISGDWLAHDWDDLIRENVGYSMGVLADTIRLLQLNNVSVMVTGVPHYPQFTGEWSARPHTVLQETADLAGAAYLNSFVALEGIITGTEQAEYYWQNDPTHFNEIGNAAWAEAQLEFMTDLDNALLPPRVEALE